MNRYFKYALDISITYYLLFFLYLSAYWLPKAILPNQSSLEWIFKLLSAGFLLYWIFIVMMILNMMEVLKIGKKRFVIILVMILGTTLLYYKAGGFE